MDEGRLGSRVSPRNAQAAAAALQQQHNYVDRRQSPMGSRMSPRGAGAQQAAAAMGYAAGSAQPGGAGGLPPRPGMGHIGTPGSNYQQRYGA